MSRISERVNILFCMGIVLLILLPVGRAEGAGDNEPNLLDLARKRFCPLNAAENLFVRPLTEAEEKLFRKVVTGELADCSDRLDKNNDPNSAKKWDKKRSIRAECVAWLCTDPEASAMLTHKGILVKGARIDGELDLQFARISFPLYFEKSAFMKGINLRYAEIREMFLIGTHTRQISADELKVEGNVFLRNGFKAHGEVRLLGATISGDLDCEKGQFINQWAKALNAAGLKVEGCVFLRYGFKANGEVNLLGATIGGRLDCTKGQFINQWATALNANIANIGSSVYLRNGFKAEGEVNLLGATIGGQLSCVDGEFIKKGKTALNASSANIDGSVFLRDGFKAEGKVNLVGATISGGLDCNDGQFINEGKDALNADGLKVERDVFLRNGFKAEGMVDLVGATIGGHLDCSESKFINPTGYALSAEYVNIKTSAYLRGGFQAKGVVSLAGATIGGHFIWTDVNSPNEVTLDLRSAKVGTLWDDPNSWPDEGKLFLHCLVYNKIDDKAPRDAKSRIKWLRRQYDKEAEEDKEQFRAQPYEQLAAVLRRSGQDAEAKKILIAKNKDKARLIKLTWSEWLWYRLFGRTIGYGYRPLNVLWGVAAFVALGSFLFGIGYWARLVTPQSESAYVERSTGTPDGGAETRELSDVYPRFNFLVYSFDTFVPLIDLHQSKYWLPNANCGLEIPKIKGLHTGGLLRLYLWIHILMGWLLSTLLVVGLTGLIRT